MANEDSPEDPARALPTPDEATVDEIVGQSALQLWAAAQTDFDPFQVPPEEWRDPIPVRDVDIAVDTGLDVEVVRPALQRLDGITLVLGSDAGNWSVRRVIPQDRPL